MCASAFLSPAPKCLLHPLTQQQQRVHLILNEAELPGLLSLVHLGGKTHRLVVCHSDDISNGDVGTGVTNLVVNDFDANSP